MKRIFGAFILFMGLCILFFVMYGSYTSDSIQNDMKKAILSKDTRNETSENLVDMTDDNGINESKSVQVEKPEEVMNILTNSEDNDISSVTKDNVKLKKAEERNHVIKNALAILSIPSINLDVAVSEGLTDLNLKYSVAHYDTSAAFGQLGNACVVGHRSHTYNRFFNRLDQVSVGDHVTLNTGSEAFTYEVKDVFIVEPKDVWVLKQHDDFAELTLITCTPVRTPTHRLIIKATLL